MLLLTRIASRTLQAPALVMLERYSFGIYVWHFIAILGVRAVVRIDAVDDFAEYHGVLVFAVSMVVATIVAYAGARLTARRIEEQEQVRSLPAPLCLDGLGDGAVARGAGAAADPSA